jgi:GH35 family endo-1,4-beta-xylanase
MAGMRDAPAGARDAEDEVLSGAGKRIVQHRQGDVTVVVSRPDGLPLANVGVSLTQQRHAFRFGCNLFRWGRIPDPKREETYRERFAALLNYATLPFYWASYERERGKPLYEDTDRVVAWCREAGIVCKGHPLAWGEPSGSPRWLPEDDAELERLSTARVRDIVRRFAGRIDIWDVVNEPTDVTRPQTRVNRWARQLGALPFTVRHLEAARAANPHATLLVNDYRVDEAYLRILQELPRSSYDVVGLQSHMHRGVWSSRHAWEVGERFAPLGLPLHFTETTIVSGPREGDRWGASTPAGEERQAEEAVRFYTVLFSHPAVEALTWWDFSDDGAWQGAAAGWLRKDMTPKPVYERLLACIRREWWTRTRGTTDAQGEWRARAFYGDYDFTVQTPGGRVVKQPLTVRKGARNHFAITLP